MIAEASNFVNSVDSTFILIVSICVFFLVLITTLMITFVIKYNRKRHPVAKNVHGSLWLEITWTIIPTIIVLVMFYFGWKGYEQMAEAPKDSMVINVTAQMWKWSFTYGNGVKTDTLYVPVNKPVKVMLHSLDVNHSFYVPAFRVKKDAIPNRNNSAWFKAEQTGRYNLTCAEYCGLNHSYMYTDVVVMPEDEFNKWLSNAAKKTAKTTKAVADSVKSD